jgi:hypothetical protein
MIRIGEINEAACRGVDLAMEKFSKTTAGQLTSKVHLDVAQQ